MQSSRFRAAEAEVFQPFRRRIVRAGSSARIDFENPLVCAVGIVSERMVREAADRAILHSEIFAPKGALRIGKVPAAGPFPDIPDHVVYAIGADAPRITSDRGGFQHDVGARSEMGAAEIEAISPGILQTVRSAGGLLPLLLGRESLAGPAAK